jgi:hypothetical protein
MTSQNNSSPENTFERKFVYNVVLKAIILFILANLIFAVWYPINNLGRISVYNHIFPGRLRLPYGDNPSMAYNLSLYNLDAMFASHELSAMPKPPGEYRIILIGDSSTWGFLLPAGQTLAACLNEQKLSLPDGRKLRAYNLGYPVMSLTKDLLILSYAMRYQPDLIVWPLTLESFPYDKQLFPPLLQNNPSPIRALINTYDLNLDPESPQFIAQTYWDRTIIGSRRSLADLLRLQFYGIMWAATGIDQDIPVSYSPRQEDLPPDVSFHNLQPPHLSANELALDVLAAGVSMAGDTPIMFINEPMFISQGENSDIRYNFFYPRWAYDDYRLLMVEASLKNGWIYLDMWDTIDASEFTNSAIHLSPEGTRQFAYAIGQAILNNR